MKAFWLETAPIVGQARRGALRRDGVAFVETTGGLVRLRHQPASGPRLLLSADGPNVIEHYDELFTHLAGRVDVTVIEPPGTGGSAPSPTFDFTLDAFARVIEDVIAARELAPVTLGLSCYLGFAAQLVAARSPALVSRVLLIQTPSWKDMLTWGDRVDPRRLLRTPVVGQALVRMTRRRMARGWYRASVGHRERIAPFASAATKALDGGGCFCLASLFQGLEQGPAPRARMPQPVTVLWGGRDRTHRASDPARSVPGARVLTFPESGHCPELEEPARFADEVSTWPT